MHAHEKFQSQRRAQIWSVTKGPVTNNKKCDERKRQVATSKNIVPRYHFDALIFYFSFKLLFKLDDEINSFGN